MTAEFLVGHLAYLPHESFMVPGRITDELLHALIIAATNVGPDALNVFATLPAQQATEVMPGMTNDVFAANNEVLLKHRAVVDEVFRRGTQAREDIFFGAVASGSGSHPALLFIGRLPPHEQLFCLTM